MPDINNLQSLYVDAISGKFVAKNEKIENIIGVQHVQTNASAVWTVELQEKITIFLVAVFTSDGNHFVKTVPDSIFSNGDNEIIIEFGAPVSGLANILFLVDNVSEL